MGRRKKSLPMRVLQIPVMKTTHRIAVSACMGLLDWVVDAA
jgi:hypothetical protein